MTNILVIGAGRSTASLIDYLLKNSGTYQWQITVADVDLKLAEEKIAGHSNGHAVQFNIADSEKRRTLINASDLVISMLPASLHGDVARDCVELGKHMATASYVSAEMKALDQEARDKKLLLLNECGLDPGLDHASAMSEIDQIKSEGGKIISFKSYGGGLVAPESNDNPWGYKFSWNPRNVVLAGQGTAQYLEGGQIKFIPYNRLFSQTEVVKIEGHNSFDAYANRDSLNYIDVYGLNSVNTMLRGTLRQRGFCAAWNVFVKLGLTDDSVIIRNAGKMNYTELLDAFLPAGIGGTKAKLKKMMGKDYNEEVGQMLEYLELFDGKPISLQEGSPAQILQALLEEKWKLKKEDKDMIVMQHELMYTLADSNEVKQIHSSLVVLGKDEHHTAMALTVGLPLAITVKNFLTNKINLWGVQIPVKKEIYEPMLTELEGLQIVFSRKRL
jgi:saccharopine dehydrogenase-like NADP-dependent oxidoreductase